MDPLLSELEEFHRVVDEQVAALRPRHASRLQCRRGCSGCCTDGLTVWEVEAARIRRDFPALLESGSPHPPGACAFLGAEGECRIYSARPHVCRAYGLPWRWIETDDSGVDVERRDICLLNAVGPRLESLPVEACWTRGPFNRTLAELQSRQGVMREIPLRSLFRSAPSAPFPEAPHVF